MRLVATIALLCQTAPALRSGPPIGTFVTYAVATAIAILLSAGLWTRVSGALLGSFELWNALFQPGDPWAKILLGTLGVALAFLGPGAWSVDARLFGWKRIEIPARKSSPH
jgi:putative oxidoreductase